MFKMTAIIKLTNIFTECHELHGPILGHIFLFHGYDKIPGLLYIFVNVCFIFNSYFNLIWVNGPKARPMQPEAVG